MTTSCSSIASELVRYKQLCAAMAERHSHALHSINSLKAICDKLSVKWDQNQLLLIRANETICDHSLEKLDKQVEHIRQQIVSNQNRNNNDATIDCNHQSLPFRFSNLNNNRVEDNSSSDCGDVCDYITPNKQLKNKAEIIISVNKNDYVVCDEEFILPLDEDVLEHQLNAFDDQQEDEKSNNKNIDDIIEKCIVKKEPLDSNQDNNKCNVTNQRNREDERLNKRKVGNTLECSECLGKFRKDYLPVHMRIHTGERPFKCEYADCDKTFSQTSSRNMHYRTHSGVKPYKCDTVADCGRKFTKRCDLIKHISSHLVYQPQNSERQRVYKCRYPNCGKSFGLVCVLQRHEVIHTGIKQFRCNSVGCKYESFWKENLREHYKRRHQQVLIA